MPGASRSERGSAPERAPRARLQRLRAPERRWGGAAGRPERRLGVRRLRDARSQGEGTWLSSVAIGHAPRGRRRPNRAVGLQHESRCQGTPRVILRTSLQIASTCPRRSSTSTESRPLPTPHSTCAVGAWSGSATGVPAGCTLRLTVSTVACRSSVARNPEPHVAFARRTARTPGPGYEPTLPGSKSPKAG